MEYQKFNKNIVIRIDKGEDIIEKIIDVATLENINLAFVSGIGAVGKFTIGLFDTKEKKYFYNNYEGDFEIISLTGNITLKEGQVYQHLHMSVADKNNNVYGGHLNSAIVSATCEIIIMIIDGNVDRKFDDNIGLNLLKFDK